ncbi:16S rRNA (cytosine(967)-C(5))-methyltransferase RsmB [Lactobacillus jensenii]|uniref:16S rRNA (cytosine(967)-C(5))-methyltransferase RsmB n=1 Tax=Lactobacillus jensenii TaxID=109790 RepID=UPI00286FBD94|nr:16S rRNA (cytosine(967)-C(5))-methyltransferase RsmB [Lactobacillus jensenii]
MTNSARAVALATLIKVFKQKSYSNLSLSHALNENNLSQKDQAFVTQLVYGTIQYQLFLEYQLKDLLRTKLKEDYLKPLLLMSVYQLIFLNRVPNRAVLDEANKLAKDFGKKNSSGFRLVNGILRSFLRRGQVLPSPKDPVHFLSIKESMPEWLVQYFVKNWGLKRTEKLLISLNERAENSIRVAKGLDHSKIVNSLQKQGFSVNESTLADNCFIVDHSIVNTNEFKSGQITIQDEAASLVVDCFDLRENDHVLDTCAAPGGKTTQLAENLSHGKVTSLDIHKKKLNLIKKYAQRMHVDDRVETLALDARKAAEHFSDTKFNKILVDAPCSGLGLLRRKPEIRYDKTIKDVHNLARIQLAILDNVAQLLKKNGEVVYSTCSITIEENEQVIAEFLKKHPEFELMPITLSKVQSKSSLKILPDTYGSDGFFIAKMKLRG